MHLANFSVTEIITGNNAMKTVQSHGHWVISVTEETAVNVNDKLTEWDANLANPAMINTLRVMDAHLPSFVRRSVHLCHLLSILYFLSCFSTSIYLPRICIYFSVASASHSLLFHSSSIMTGHAVPCSPPFDFNLSTPRYLLLLLCLLISNINDPHAYCRAHYYASPDPYMRKKHAYS